MPLFRRTLSEKKQEKIANKLKDGIGTRDSGSIYPLHRNFESLKIPVLNQSPSRTTEQIKQAPEFIKKTKGFNPQKKDDLANFIARNMISTEIDHASTGTESGPASRVKREIMKKTGGSLIGIDIDTATKMVKETVEFKELTAKVDPAFKNQIARRMVEFLKM